MVAAAAFVIASPTVYMARGSGTAIIARMYAPAVVVVVRLPAIVVRDRHSLHMVVQLGSIRI